MSVAVATMTKAGDLSARSVSTTNGFNGSLSGNVTGNVTGDVTGSVNGVSVFVKTGNNGTVNCDAYCSNAGFEERAGACIGVRLSNQQYTADCGYTPGFGRPLSCLSASW